MFSLKLEILKQILTSASTPPQQDTQPQAVLEKTSPQNNQPNRRSPTRNRKGRPPSKASLTPDPPISETPFEKLLVQSTNPDLLNLLQELNENFLPLVDAYPDILCDTCLIISSDRVHEIPYHALQFFSKFQFIYKDFSIMSAINRGTLTNVPLI